MPDVADADGIKPRPHPVCISSLLIHQKSLCPPGSSGKEVFCAACRDCRTTSYRLRLSKALSGMSRRVACEW